MLIHRLRRWPNITPALSERLLFAVTWAGVIQKQHDTLNQHCFLLAHRLRRWATIEPTVDQR